MEAQEGMLRGADPSMEVVEGVIRRADSSMDVGVRRVGAVEGGEMLRRAQVQVQPRALRLKNAKSFHWVFS